MEEIKPVRPKDLIDTIETAIPSVVIQAVNNLLKKNFRGDFVIIKQKDILKEIKKLDKSMTSEKIFENKWMDFEEIYIKNGWNVVYDGPSWDESYDETFKFTPKK